MIKRYSREEISKIWELESKFSYYLKVELAVCEAYEKFGKIKSEDLKVIKERARFDLKRIDEIESEVKHDVIAFLTNVNENIGEAGRFVHMGLTSSDVIDTAFALQIKDAGKIIEEDLLSVIETLKVIALKHKDTVCIGRSHGIHAEVMTFGIKMLNWIDMFERALKGFIYALEEVTVGQISGPVGTYSNVEPEIEDETCKLLGLKPARISTQVISRDRHAAFMQSLSAIASIVELCSVELRHLQRSEVREVEEGFGEGQKGSSAMPHKKNPISAENLSGLARVIRANALAASENVALWHERDISHSSVERIIFPDSTILIDYMLNRFNNLMKNLVVNEKNMKKNANLSGGVIYSQNVLLKLVEKGKSREEAYKVVQKYALEALDEGGNFKEKLRSDNVLSNEEIEECFSEEKYLKNVDLIFTRFFKVI